MTDAAGLVALLAAIIGCLVYTRPYIRERKRLKAEKQANCSHSWHHFEAMNNPEWPMRECRLCKKQEQLTACLRCGKVFERDTRREARPFKDV